MQLKNSVKIAVCAVSAALSVVLLFLGGVIFVFAYIMPMLSSVLMIMLRKTFGVSGALTTYVSTSLLSLIVVADKECALMYILFFGFYPILYPELKKIKSKLLRAISKLLIFNIMLAIIQLLLVYVFGIPFTEEGEGTVFIAVSQF